MTGQSRYAELARRYARRWAEPIQAGQVPRFLLPPGIEAGGSHDRAYRRFVGMAGDLSDPLERAENLLASDAIDALLACDDEVCRSAARRLVEVMIDQIADPDAGPLADAVRRYRGWTGDGSFDAVIVDASSAFVRPGTIGIEPQVLRDRRPAGIGKRTDMPAWFEDGRPRRVNPITLYVAGEIEGDEAKSIAAVDLARAQFNLARQVYPDGRDHGCSARSVSAVARGHGRDNNAGMVTAVLAPALNCAG
jgi:hypothetical protein